MRLMLRRTDPLVECAETVECACLLCDKNEVKYFDRCHPIFRSSPWQSSAKTSQIVGKDLISLFGHEPWKRPETTANGLKVTVARLAINSASQGTASLLRASQVQIR